MSSYLDYMIIKHNISLGTEERHDDAARLTPLALGVAAFAALVAAAAALSCRVRAEVAARRGGDQGSRRCPPLQVPAQWRGRRRRRARWPTTGSPRSTTTQLTAAVDEAIAHNADLRVGAARVEQALLYAKLAGREALSVGRPAGARRRQDVRRRLRPAGRRAHR